MNAAEPADRGRGAGAPPAPSEAWLLRFSRHAGHGIAIVGALVLAGWAFEIPALKGVAPNLATMKANTAGCFIVLGLALSLLQSDTPARRRAGRGLAAFGAAIGLVTLAEYLLGSNLGLDELLFSDRGANPLSPHPGRMSAMTALNFSLLGIALVLPRAAPGALRAGDVLATLAGMIGFVACAGYIFETSALYRVSVYSSMAVHTAFLFVVLALAILTARPFHGFAMLLLGDDAAAGMVRRLLPAAVLVPLVFGWLWLLGQQQEYYGTEFGIALLATSNAIVFTGVILAAAVSLRRMDANRRAAEATTRASEERLRMFVENVPDYAILTLDPRGFVATWNSGAERIKGYQAGEILGQHFSRFFLPEDIAAGRPERELQVALAEGKFAEEGWRVRKDGSRFWASVVITPLRDEQGGVRGFGKITRDITERKRATDQLQVSLKEVGDLKAALDEHAIVAITDARGKITYVNDKFCAISQYSRQELLGQDHRLINSGHHSKEFIRDLWMTISGGNVWQGEIKNRAKDGSFYWVATTLVPFLDAQGKPQQYVAIRTDVTRRKQAEEDIRQLNARLDLRVRERTAELAVAKLRAERADRLKSEFLATMSHELRTPLNSVIGFTEFLYDEKPGPLKPKQKEYLSDVLNSARHLLQLINDVLDLAKVEAGKMELHPEVFPVRKAVEEVGAVVKGIAHKKHVQVGIQVDDGLEAVTLDQHKFKQVLYNLLSNAVKFTDDGGQVGIHARRENGQLEVRVRDTGIGIKAGDLKRLFTEFEQLDAGTARRFEGTGLGLALTKKIVEFQGGHITVESEPGKGSVFTVILPLRMAEKEAA